MPQGNREELHLVIAGHVDHGKSTIIGRLLADTDSLPQGKLDAVKEKCRKNSKPFEYAFLLDALKDEQSQGITIDIARCFFKTAKRDYLIIDAPGHIEFLRNMITGASYADAALLVVDAAEGLQENSRRHAYMLSMLGIHQIAVLMNKMDLVKYDMQVFTQLKLECEEYFKKIGIEAVAYIPISGMQGDNIAAHSESMPWADSLTVLEQLDKFALYKSSEDKPLRMPVQDVYKFTACQDNRRIIAGRVESGSIKVGDDVIFYPSGKKSQVKSIEKFPIDMSVNQAGTGSCPGVTLSEQIYIRRGEVMVKSLEKPPVVASKVKAKVFWLGASPMFQGEKYTLKLGTSKQQAELEEILTVTNASTLEEKANSKVDKNDIAECIFSVDSPIAFDIGEEIHEMGRFVLVHDYEISGGGVIISAVEASDEWLKSSVLRRNIKWESGSITEEERADKYKQKPVLILLTGPVNDDSRKRAARYLERRLFNEGKLVYCIGMRNLIYGLDADIIKDCNFSEIDIHKEYFRRFAEMAYIMLDAGMILIATARDVSKHEIEFFERGLYGKDIPIIFEYVTCDEAEDSEYMQNMIEKVYKRLTEGFFIS